MKWKTKYWIFQTFITNKKLQYWACKKIQPGWKVNAKKWRPLVVDDKKKENGDCSLLMQHMQVYGEYTTPGGRGCIKKWRNGIPWWTGFSVIFTDHVEFLH